MLKKQLKRSMKNSETALSDRVGRDLERNLDDINKMEDTASAENKSLEETTGSENTMEDVKTENIDVEKAIELYKEKGFLDVENDSSAISALKEAGYTVKENSRGTVHVIELERMNEDDVDSKDPEETSEVPQEDLDVSAEVPDHLDTDLEEPEETFKDINEKMVVYLYRGFAELGDNIKVFVGDTENEERDPELVTFFEEFMEGYPEVMDAIKELAKKYVTSVDLYDTDAEEEIPVEDEEPSEEADEVDLEDELEDKAVVESYIKENNLEYNMYDSDYEIYVPFKSKESAAKYEEELKKFKGAEVFVHDSIGEIHAFVRVK